MTKVGKTLIGVLVAVDLAFVFYIMSPQTEHSRSKSDDAAEAAAKGAELEAGVIANASKGPQVASGSIAGNMADSDTPNSTSDAGRVVTAPPVTAPPAATTSAGRVVTAPPPAASNASRIAAVPPPKPVAVPNVLLDGKSTSTAVAAAPQIAPTPAPGVSGNASEQRVAVRQQAVKTVDVTNAQKSADTKTSVASRRERPAVDARSNNGSNSGSNSVSAAMTEALVRQSAVLDPNLPPPDMSKSVSVNDASNTSSHGGANPVAAAMTEQLVRESTRFTPPAHHAPTQPGVQ